jgi:hypothetical protein
MLQVERSGVRVPMKWIFFKLSNLFRRTMALGSTQHITEMSMRNLPGGVKGDWRVRLKTSPPSMSRLFKENKEASTPDIPLKLHGLLQG